MGLKSSKEIQVIYEICEVTNPFIQDIRSKKFTSFKKLVDYSLKTFHNPNKDTYLHLTCFKYDLTTHKETQFMLRIVEMDDAIDPSDKLLNIGYLKINTRKDLRYIDRKKKYVQLQWNNIPNDLEL